MKVYSSGSRGQGTLFVTPGAEHPDNRAWLHAATNLPLSFTVRFKDGVAEVDADMGKYLIDEGLAHRSPPV